MSAQDDILAEHADLKILIGHVQALGKRVEAVEARLLAIEHQVGLNGHARIADTEPAPATQPENEKPEEPGAPA